MTSINAEFATETRFRGSDGDALLSQTAAALSVFIVFSIL